MSIPSKRRILVVDDEPAVREVLAAILRAAGYEVATAANGFEALLQLKRVLPAVIISDLNMPKMSGFELLSVVRRRFPTVSVIASSGAYAHEIVPSGVIADAFHAKGQSDPQTLLATVAGLIRTIRVTCQRTSAGTGSGLDSAQRQRLQWNPLHRAHLHGMPALFPLNVSHETIPEVLETPCLFCPNTVRYIIDFSLSVVSPKAVSDLRRLPA